MRAFSVLAFMFAVGFSQAALAAPPKLVDSKPAEGALVTRPGVMQLSFDQPVDASSAAYEVLMMTMPGMTMSEPMRMTVEASSFDVATGVLTAKLKAPLPAGGYKVNWRVKNAAGEEGAGVLNFDVR